MGGLVPQPISYEAIDRWAHRFGLFDPDEFDRFLTLLMAMDSEYMNAAIKRINKSSKGD